MRETQILAEMDWKIKPEFNRTTEGNNKDCEGEEKNRQNGCQLFYHVQST